jgi:hypothetical protein
MQTQAKIELKEMYESFFKQAMDLWIEPEIAFDFRYNAELMNESGCHRREK